MNDGFVAVGVATGETGVATNNSSIAARVAVGSSSGSSLTAAVARVVSSGAAIVAVAVSCPSGWARVALRRR